MSKYRVCLNCGCKINILQSIIYNKCCSYKCDLREEEKRDKREREDWEMMMREKSLRRMKHGSVKVEASNKEEDVIDNSSNEENIQNDFNNEQVNEFYDYCLTDDNNDEDYTY